jgi:hypothetical protein
MHRPWKLRLAPVSGCVLLVCFGLVAVTPCAAQQPEATPTTTNQAPGPASPTAAQLLLSAKTLCVLVPSGNAVLKTEISNRLLR